MQHSKATILWLFVLQPDFFFFKARRSKKNAYILLWFSNKRAIKLARARPEEGAVAQRAQNKFKSEEQLKVFTAL